MTDTSLQFDPMYPDVLGAITGGVRVNLDTVQFAVGVFPRQAYLNQPIEIIVVLQNVLDQDVDVKIGVQLPVKDKAGNSIHMVTPKKMLERTLSAGEVGVMRIPALATEPTAPGDDYPIRVAVRARARHAGRVMRAPAGGAPPSALAVSPFKLQVLRDVPYVEHPHSQSPDMVTTHFSVAPRVLPAPKEALNANYEKLWSAEQMPAERQHIAQKVEEARVMAVSFTRPHVYAPLVKLVDEHFASNGLPLHPGEARAIAKMITYTLDDTLVNDPTFQMEDMRWFQALCQALASDPEIARWEPADIVTRFLFEAAFYDAILVGFSVVRPRVRVNLGDRAERIAYAQKMLGWLGGQVEPDLVYIYLPLALGGLAVNVAVTGDGDNPWQMLDDMREAYRGRVRLASGSVVEIFDMCDKLLERAEDDLRRARINRP